MKKTIFLFIFVALLPLAQAYTYLNIYIDEKGETQFLGETNESLNLPEGIEIKGDKIIGMTSKLTNKQRDVWTFSYSLPEAELNIILPKGAVIKTTTSQEIYTDNNRLSIFALNSISVSYSIENTNDGNNSLLISAIIIFLIIIALSITYKKRKNKKEQSKKRKPIKKDKLEIIKSVLSERERLIIGKLKETGKIKQSRLRKFCDNMPKASFSRHVQELEKKNLIKRSGEGKNKFVELAR